MYCSHCGKKFDELAIEKKQSSYVQKDANGELVAIDSDAKVEYVCPQCVFYSQVGKIPWRRKCNPLQLLWPGEFHGQRRLAGYSPRTPLSD